LKKKWHRILVKNNKRIWRELMEVFGKIDDRICKKIDGIIWYSSKELR
jgi:hypothetical protein